MIHHKKSSAIAILCALFIATTPSLPCAEVHAQETNKVEELSERGADLFGKKKYKQAIETFLQAYEIEAVANLLYNIALCYDRLGDLDNASVYYEKFIIAPDADPDVRSRALARSKEIQEIKAQEKTKKNDPPPPPPPKETSTLMIGGIIASGSGVVLLATGAIFGSMVSGDVDTFDKSRDLTTKQQAADDATSNALTADVLFGLGTVSLATGLGLILYDVLSENETQPQPSSIRILPSLQPNSVGATLHFTLPE